MKIYRNSYSFSHRDRLDPRSQTEISENVPGPEISENVSGVEISEKSGSYMTTPEKLIQVSKKLHVSLLKSRSTAPFASNDFSIYLSYVLATKTSPEQK